jgi:hypothetical protein
MPTMGRTEIRRVSLSLGDFGLQAELNLLAGRGCRIVSVFPQKDQYVIVAQQLPPRQPQGRAQPGRGRPRS